MSDFGKNRSDAFFLSTGRVEERLHDVGFWDRQDLFQVQQGGYGSIRYYDHLPSGATESCSKKAVAIPIPIVIKAVVSNPYGIQPCAHPLIFDDLCSE